MATYFEHNLSFHILQNKLNLPNLIFNCKSYGLLKIASYLISKEAETEQVSKSVTVTLKSPLPLILIV